MTRASAQAALPMFGTVAVRAFDQRDQEVPRDVEVWWERGGLIVHHTPRTHGGFSTLLWSVSHRASGYALLQELPNAKRAVEAAERLLASGIDWTLSADEVRQVPGAVDLQRDVARLFGVLAQS